MRGIDYERLLARRLSRLGFAVVRAPSSGSGTKMDRPDIIAGRRGLIVAIEVKTTSRRRIYVGEKGVEQLVRFSECFGATPYIAVKFKGSGMDWLLIHPRYLKREGGTYSISLEEASRIGITLESLILRRLGEYS
ncbi:MAG: Holliday junction resolvase Hjc [Nitrososphaerota archaeon]|nr:Holliday junction resolvase Hjc [Candidatus Bathyarchaeota archaeon]MDW8061180.1 Holliday junction resolvase Hjc [Nitrososphaerota archaeon]